MPLLQAKKISISFSSISILENVDFLLQQGEINCLCGENGAGKSTLVKVLSGIYSEYSGEIFINDKLVSMKSPTEAVKHGIYAIQQHRDLAPSLNAVENMFMCNELYIRKSKQRFDFNKMTKLAKEYISKFGVEINLDVPVKNLKISEQGIIAICKALVAQSKILLIDEASAPLDDEERSALYKSLQNLAKEGTGIVYITHHLDEVFRIGDSVTVLKDGKNVGRYSINELDKTKLIAKMTGNVHFYQRDLTEAKNYSEEKVIEVKNLSAKGINNISFYVRKGEVLGIAGLEGSGKDLIALTCFGYKKAQNGELIIKGEKTHLQSTIDAIRHNIGLIPNNRKEAGLVLCRDIADNITISYLNKYNIAFISGYRSNRIANAFIDKIRIKCSGPNQIVEYLSGGNQQKVLVSKWLQTKVDILFMIEPTEGIDIAARADLYGIFRELAKEGKAIIIATSDIDELMELSDRILTMAGGSIVNEYEIDQADKQIILADILKTA